MKIKVEHIVKQGSQYCLKSKKNNKNLGCAPSHAGAEKREKQVQYFKHLNKEEETLEEMSGAGGGFGGGMEGSPGVKKMDRETFLAELKVRKFIKEAIRKYNDLKEAQEYQTTLEEQKIRNFIRVLLRESEEDRPHHSTGINVLSDLLKKIIPVIEIDYKKMTSSPTQRQSFRAHLLKAAQNTMDAEKLGDESDGDQPAEPSQNAMMHEDNPDASLDLDVEPKAPVDPEAQKFIDVERPSQKKAKQKKEDPMDSFKIEGEDETGRNIAMSTYQKVEKGIQDSYSILSDPEDKRLFYDYLITNLKLYFDKFEDELKANVQEPESAGYEQGQNGQGGTPDQGLGL